MTEGNTLVILIPISVLIGGGGELFHSLGMSNNFAWLQTSSLCMIISVDSRIAEMR